MALNQGFPFSPLMSHFRGLRDGVTVEYKFLDRIQHSRYGIAMEDRNGMAGLGWGGTDKMCTLHHDAGGMWWFWYVKHSFFGL